MCQANGRCVLIYLNVLFLIIGALLSLAIGIWVHVDNRHVIPLLRIIEWDDNSVGNDRAVGWAYSLIGCGAFALVISVFGFCAEIKKSRCCLLTYGLLVAVTWGYTSIVGVNAIQRKIQIDSWHDHYDYYSDLFPCTAGTRYWSYLTATGRLNWTLQKIYKGPYDHSDIASLALDTLQASQSCCGIYGPRDFSFYPDFDKTWKSAKNAVIPFTCCASSKMSSFPDNINDYISGLTDPNCPLSLAKGYQRGCYSALGWLGRTYYAWVAGGTVAVALIELVLISGACCIAIAHKN